MLLALPLPLALDHLLPMRRRVRQPLRERAGVLGAASCRGALVAPLVDRVCVDGEGQEELLEGVGRAGRGCAVV